MNAAVIGLGLIGGSMAKAIKQNTDYKVYGYDRSQPVVSKAISDNAIDAPLGDNIGKCDIIIIALYPEDIIKYIKENAQDISPDAVVVDCGGTKSKIYDEIKPVAEKFGFTFVGGHPMAGIERSGFDYSDGKLFKGASMILTPYENTGEIKLDFLSEFIMSLGFGEIKITTPQLHDRMIAYTSQLAHVVSSAYVKSPIAENFKGFSAGSFKDMTRVAKLNEDMWTKLFLENADFLADEVSLLIKRLEEYETAIRTADRETLCMLLKEGREIKERIDT